MITIAKSAIRYNDKIYYGWRHHLIGHQMIVDGVCKLPFPGGDAQGFITSDGFFVGREEAFQIAQEANQGNLHPENEAKLYSEDLWDKEGNPVSLR